MGDKTIRVDVTAADIAAGVRNDPQSCPVARALTRTLRMPHSLVFGDWHGRTVGVARMDGLGARFRLSRAVGAWAIRFDDGLPVEPFSFRVVR